MRSKLIHVSAVFGLLFVTFTGSLFAQTEIKIHYQNGTEQIYSIEEEGKLYFASEDLVIQPDPGMTETTIPVSIIRKITFTEGNVTSTKVIASTDPKLKVFPNPANDYIQIEASGKELNVSIFDIQGILISSGIYKNNQAVDISKLSAGTYLVQVNDNSTIKFIKK